MNYLHGYKRPPVFDGLTIFGCTSECIRCDRASNIIFRNGTFTKETAFPTNYGYYTVGSSSVKFENCTFGTVGTPFTLNDIFSDTVDSSYITVVTLNNCTLNCSTQVKFDGNGNSYESLTAVVYSSNHQQIAGNYQTYKYRGIISKDTVIYDNSPSMRLTPNTLNTTVPLYSGDFCIPVANATSKTLSAKVRQSVIGDGATYNGSRIQMWAKANYNGGGYASDTLLATASIASEGAWELLSATLPIPTQDTVYEIYFTCDGSAGFVNIDTLRIT